MVLKNLCWSTIFWGIISLIGIIINTVSLGFSVSYLTLGTLTSIGFLYALQCICVGGCWLYAWTFPLVTVLSIIFTIMVAGALFLSSAKSGLTGALDAAAAATAAPTVAATVAATQPAATQPAATQPAATPAPTPA